MYTLVAFNREDLSGDNYRSVIFNHERINILVLGLDIGNGFKNGGYERTDTILLQALIQKIRKPAYYRFQGTVGLKFPGMV